MKYDEKSLIRHLFIVHILCKQLRTAEARLAGTYPILSHEF